MLASEVTAQAAVLLNDASQAFWTNTVLLPCLTKANEELEQLLEINEVPLQKQVSQVIDVDSGDTELALPTNFVEPIHLQERLRDSTDDWSDFLTRVSWIDPNDTTSSVIDSWAWRDNKVLINPPDNDREVLLYYTRKLTPLVAAGDTVELAQSKTWLAARTAQIAAQNLGNNPTKAEELQVDVARAEDMLLRRLVKNTQALGVRRQGYKGNRRIWPFI
jgi:hypothetical protein